MTRRFPAQFIEQPVPDTSSQRLGPVLAWALQHLVDKPMPDRLAAIPADLVRPSARQP